MRWILRSLFALIVALSVAPAARAQEPFPARDDRSATWLGGADVGEAARLRTARVRDAFVGTAFEAEGFGAPGLKLPAPARATRFVAGDAGPEHFAVIYDRAHGIVLYSIGCCSWRDVVLRARRGTPPRAFVDRDLRAVRTRAGVALGDSAARVQALWGPTAPTTRGGRTVYAYWTPLRPHPKSGQMYAGCGQRLQAELEHDRVTAILIGSEC